MTACWVETPATGGVDKAVGGVTTEARGVTIAAGAALMG